MYAANNTCVASGQYSISIPLQKSPLSWNPNDLVQPSNYNQQFLILVGLIGRCKSK